MPRLNELAQKPFDAERAYGEVVHVVHVLVTEPHPIAPDFSPYSSAVKEFEYSTIRQPMTYTGRAAVGADTARLLEGEQLLVVDALDPVTHVNPIWCTYGPTPNGAFLIAQDGTIRAAWEWLDVDALESAIDEELSP